MSQNAIFNTDNATAAFEAARLGHYPGPVEILAFSPDGSLLAAATYRRLYIWDVAARELLFEEGRLVRDLRFHPSGEILAVAGKNIDFLSLPSGEKESTLKSHQGETSCLAYSPDGKLLASGSADGKVFVGNLETRRLARSLEHEGPVQAMAYSPDGRWIATLCVGEDVTPQVYLWDMDSGESRSLRCDKKAKHLHFSPDSRFYSVDGIIYEVERMQAVYDLREKEAIFSPDGNLIVTCRNDFTTIGLWNSASGDKLGVLKGHDDPIWSIAFNPDGTLLASGSGAISLDAQDLSVRLWEVPAPPEAPVEEVEPAPRERKPLKRLGGDDDDSDDDGNPLKDIFNRLSR